MVRSILLFVLALGVFADSQARSFKEDQLRYPRVRSAFKEQGQAAKKLFLAKNLSWPPNRIFFRAFKADRSLELWAFDKRSASYVLIKDYEICRLSGKLGPKRRQGDEQIPEGFYQITGFNPFSSYHLSMRVNYPNRSDQIRGKRGSLGGDIFVHGRCVTIGCLPMTDNIIKQIYVIAVEAKSAGARVIPIHIFPTKLSKDRIKALLEGSSELTTWGSIKRTLGLRTGKTSEHLKFWRELKVGYDFFEKNRRLPIIKVASDGRYVVKPSR